MTTIGTSRPSRRRKRVSMGFLFGIVALGLVVWNLGRHGFLSSFNLINFTSLDNSLREATAAAEHTQRLQFVQLSGTEGNRIVYEASRHDITWGICHFMDSTVRTVQITKSENFTCPDSSSLTGETPLNGNQSVPWHYVPPRSFSIFPHNPYEGAHLFTVVRNVYDRLLAEYYYRKTVMDGWSFDKTNQIQHLNSWLRLTLAALKKRPQMKSGDAAEGSIVNIDHLVPQYDICFDEKKQQLVEHVLRFESLEDDFDALMEQYGLPLRLSSHKVFPADKGGIMGEPKLSVYNLTKHNLVEIEQIYKDDFREWGYDVMSTQIHVKTFEKTAQLISSQENQRFGSNTSSKQNHGISKEPQLARKALPLLSPFSKEIMEESNLTYPKGWFPKTPREAPSPDTFVYTPDRLEFIHVPKTGGTMLECAAARHDITWGLCHFSRPQNAFKICPGNVPTRKWSARIRGVPWWHLPSYYFNMKDRWPANPYQNAKLFCVVRNPHERMVSEYHYAAKIVMRWTDERRNNVTAMNEWLTARLRAFRYANKGNLTRGRVGGINYFQMQGHFIPQYEYVFDHAGTQVIQHIVKFETLHEDFGALMKDYGLNITLPAKDVRIGPKYDKKIGVKDLGPELVQLIEDVYEKDYDFFEYTRLPRDIHTGLAH